MSFLNPTLCWFHSFRMSLERDVDAAACLSLSLALEFSYFGLFWMIQMVKHGLSLSFSAAFLLLLLLLLLLLALALALALLGRSVGLRPPALPRVPFLLLLLVLVLPQFAA